MTPIQSISRQEQMEAFRKDFLAYWDANVEPVVMDWPPSKRAELMIRLWRIWLTEHGVKT